MSRHRNVRSMNYEDEYDGYDDVYGHSVEDDYCVSPATASQFLYDRNNVHPLASYMQSEEAIEEDEEDPESLQSSASFTTPNLSDLEQAQLNSCLEELRSIVGESTADHILVPICIQAKYDVEKAANLLLNQQEAPKPQRTARERKYRGGRKSTIESDIEASSDVPTTTKSASEVESSNAQGEPAVAGLARMTFSSGKQAFSGFTPEKTGLKESESNDALDKSKIAKTLQLGKDETLSSSNKGTVSQDDGTSDDNRNISDLTKPINRNASSSALSDMGKPINRNISSSALSELGKIKLKLDNNMLLQEFNKRKDGGKEHINLVVIGHVDAGKSTLMGHVLYQLGFVNKRTMHKYEQESKKAGKASFAYAWVLDETEEERSRGVTMDIAQTRFETDNRIVTLLDAPGHKDFIPNMITGAAQADVAILVVNSARGEFETGFDSGGQTREHTMLIRSLGVSQLVIAINKMDAVEWSKTRFDEICHKLKQFLKQSGFKENDVTFIPVSGLLGENLTKECTVKELSSWYTGPTLVQQIDKFAAPDRSISAPFRMCVTDVYKGMGAGFSVMGTLQAGSIQVGERVLSMPHAELATVKGITIEEVNVQCAFAGDNVILILTGIDLTNLTIGSILCDPSSPIKSTSRLKARVVIFNIDLPITKGFPVVFHYQSLNESGFIRKLVSQLHKSTGQVVRTKPRCLTKNSSAVVEVELNRPVCVELYKDFKDLGRFMLRYCGATIAAGIVTQVVDKKG